MKNEMCKMNVVGKGFVDPQGQVANINGQKLEERVENVLVKLGAYAMSHSDFEKEFLTLPEGARGLLLKNVPHTTPYGTRGYHEFSLRGVVPGNVRIECRSQQVGGTVDEKLPYLLESVKIANEGVVWIILDGEGFRPNSKDWLKKNADSIKYKKIKVFTSFSSWKDWINVVFN